ncbi:MAG TPA: PAS domain-containing protein [Gaiellaceae bacterium]|nr:PAS domain-containing protein [Gaiellaceae bacterium]
MQGGRLNLRLLEVLLDAIPVGVSLLDASRRIIDCNAALCRMLGRTRDELIGHRGSEFSTPTEDTVAPLFRDLVAGAVDRFVTDSCYLEPDGSRAWMRITCSVVDREDEIYLAVVEDVSEQSDAIEMLRERTTLLTHVKQIGGVGSWVWYPRENLNEWSPEALRIYGISEEAAQSRDPALFFDLLHPDDRDEVLRRGWESFQLKRPMSAEFRIRREDGYHWVRDQSDVECDADGNPWRMVGVVMDITDRKRAETELREKTAVLERAHDLAKLGSFTVDLATRRTHGSRETAHLLGCEGPFTLGLEEFRERFVPEDVRDAWAEHHDTAYRQAGTFSSTQRMQTLAGEQLWVRVHGLVDVDEVGTPVRVIGLMQDITEQRLLEEQVRQTEKMQAVGQLASGIAHDFNNLLLVIGGNAQLALAADAGPASRRQLDEILHAAGHAGDLVRRLLAFARNDASEPRNVELNSVVRDVRRMLDRVIEKQIEIRTDLTDADTTVFADPPRLEQAVLNLAVNARDAMPDGGQLTIRTEVAGATVLLEVRDTGIGMDAQTRERIFEPFFTTKDVGAGTGLGLATVYGAVAESHGRISVDSEPGRGTIFTIALPHATRNAETTRRLEPAPLVPGGGERILLVEDDPMVRAVSAELLTRAGYTIDVAGDGVEALDLLGRGDPYDLIVSDLMMPRMTGLQLASALEERGVDVPIVFTSGYAEHEPKDDRARVRFVPKPFTGAEVTAAVSELLQTR